MNNKLPTVLVNSPADLLHSTSMSPATRLPLLNLVRLKEFPIMQQLHFEERLLRTSSDNWCIINDGTNERNIVMGISGKPAELLERNLVIRDKVPVIRRFTGGGTVIVDHGTVFVTFICNKDAFPDLQPYPRPIMKWSRLIYDKVFEGIGDFSLRENDYVFGNRKFGGNAQSITKDRWIHHTSFLWDYDKSNMVYLKLPRRAPEYREERDHLDFICRMKDYVPRPGFIERIMDALNSHFLVKSIKHDEVESLSSTLIKFTPSTRLLLNHEIEEEAAAKNIGLPA